DDAALSEDRHREEMTHGGFRQLRRRMGNILKRGLTRAVFFRGRSVVGFKEIQERDSRGTYTNARDNVLIWQTPLLWSKWSLQFAAEPLDGDRGFMKKIILKNSGAQNLVRVSAKLLLSNQTFKLPI